MSSELGKVGYLKIIGIAVSAFMLGFGSYKGILEMQNLDTVPETELENLRKKVAEIESRPTIEAFNDKKEELARGEKELALWKNEHAEWIFQQTELKKAWVKIWKDDNFRGTSKTFMYGQDNPNFHSINFDNEGSSAKWKIPVGYRAVLYGDNTYHGSKLVFEGTGKEKSINNFENYKVGDQGSSLRWEKSP